MFALRLALLLGCCVGALATNPLTGAKFSESIYCGSFKVSDVGLQVQIHFVSDSQADISAALYGFVMDCKRSAFTMYSNGSIALDEELNGEKSCLAKQFEEVDTNIGDFTLNFKKHDDIVSLMAEGKRHTLTKSACKDEQIQDAFPRKPETPLPFDERRLGLQVASPLVV